MWVLTWGNWNENEWQADKSARASKRGSENDEFHDEASLEESRTVSFEANDTFNRLSILQGYLRASAQRLRSSMLKINIHTWLGNLINIDPWISSEFGKDFQSKIFNGKENELFWKPQQTTLNFYTKLKTIVISNQTYHSSDNNYPKMGHP